MANSNSRASKASRAKTNADWQKKQTALGKHFKFCAVLKEPYIAQAKKIKNKPNFLKNALKYLDENGELK